VSKRTATSWARKAGIRGRGKPGKGGHPGRAEYERLRTAGVRRREAAVRADVHPCAGQGWGRGIRPEPGVRVFPRRRHGPPPFLSPG
jgi:transposase, IS30 family